MPVILEPIIIAAVGWVVSPVVTRLLNEAFASVGIDAEKKLQKLRITVLPLLNSVIRKAEGSKYHFSEVEDWLRRLKDAYDGVQVALDILNNRRLKRKAAAAAAASSSKRQSNYLVRTPFHVPKHLKWAITFLKRGRDMLSPSKIKLKRRLNKFEKIASEAQTIRSLLEANSDQTLVSYGQTISLPPWKMFGRGEDREDIIRRLKREPAAAGIPIITLVGSPGVGKTAHDRRLEGEIARLTAAAEVKAGEIAALERRVGALKEAEDDLRKRNALLAEKIREKDDALAELGERNSLLEAEIVELNDALVVCKERSAVLDTAAVLGAVSAGAAAAAAATAVYLRCKWGRQ